MLFCITLLPYEHDLFPCGKKKTCVPLLQEVAKSKSIRLEIARSREVISSLVCYLRLSLAELLSTFEPKPYLQNPNLPILAVCLYCGIQPKARNCLWLSARFNWKYQFQIYAPTTLGRKVLILHWHIVGTEFLNQSLSFIGLLSVPSFSLLVPQVLHFYYACKSTFGERQK